MVAVVSGNGLGLNASSLAALGASGGLGSAAQGQNGQKIFVNSVTGNLIIQDQDESLASLGADLRLVRTYNSQGQFTDDNGDNWCLGVHQKLLGLTGTVNTAGSTITKVFGDGSEAVYAYNATAGLYVSSEGDGAHDTLSYSTGAQQWTWTEGSTRLVEVYDSNGRLVSSQDVDGNATTYAYTDGLLRQITDASGQVTHLDYTGSNLTQVRVVIDSQTETRTRYSYDGQDRLTQVTVDLSPQDNSVTDGNTYVTTYTYDGSSNRVASVAQSDGTSIGFTYEQISGLYRVKTYTDGAGRVTTLNYANFVGGGGGGGTPATADADPNALTTTEQTGSTDYSLDSGALTTPSVGWDSAALLESDDTVVAGWENMASDANGNVFALWIQGQDVFVRRFDKATNSWSAAVDLTTVSNTTFTPKLAVDAQGNALVGWVQSDGTAASTYVSRYDAATQSWSAAQLVESVSAAVSTTDGLVVDINGGYAAVSWVQSSSLYVARLSGGTWAARELVESSSNSASKPAIAVDSSGNVSVLWQQSDGTAVSVYANRYSVASSSWGSAALLESSGTVVSTPKLAFDGNGNGIAVWQQGNDLFARRYDKATDTWAAAVALDSRTATVGSISLSVDAQGNAIAGWVQNDGTANSAYVNRFDQSTGTWGSATLVESVSQAVANSGLAVAINGGYATVSWLQTNGTQNDLYVARYSSGAWGARTLVESSSNAVNGSVITLDAQGNVAVMWNQSTGAANSMWTNRYNNETTPYYAVQSGDTWASIAQTLYGVGSTAAGTALQSALGSPTLVTGLRLTGMPATLTVSTTTTVPAYQVQSGDTWESITQAIYGTSDPGAIEALQDELGNPTLTVGAYLIVPATLSYTATTVLTADVDTSELSTTEEQTTSTDYSLDSGALTTPSVGWEAAILLESDDTVSSGWEQIAFDATGNGFALWCQGSNTFVRRYDKVTNSWGSAVALDTGSTTVSIPTLMVDPQGNAIAAWVQSDGTADSTYVSRYDASTQTWSSAQLVETVSTAVSTTSGRLAVAINGSLAAVAWVQSSSIYVARFTGGSWQARELIESNSNAASRPSIALDSSGNVSAVWQQSDGTAASTYVNRYSVSSSSWGTATLLESSGTAVGEPQIAFDGVGNGMAVWQQGNDVFARRYDKATDTWAAAVTIDSRTNSVTSVRLVVDAQGNAIAAWVQSDGTASSTYTSRYNQATATWGAATLVETASQAVATFSMATGIDGSYAATAWLQSNGTVNDLYVARFSGGSWQARELIDSGSTAVNGSVITLDAQGNIAVMWNQSNATSNSMWVRRYNNETTPYYLVQAGDTWASIAQALYDVGTSAAGDALQSALGGPTLVTGLRLTGMPATLTVSTTTTVTVPAYYEVQAGDTWSSITQTLYGTSATNAVSALQDALLNPTLTTGLHLTVPEVLTYAVEATGGSLATETEIESPLGFVTTLTNDSNGRLIGMMSPMLGSIQLETQYEYDADGNVTAVIEDPEGLNRVTTFEYDDAGNLLLTRDAAGNTVARTYNSANQLLTETRYTTPDPDGAGSGTPGGGLTTRYAYDSDQHLRYMISADGRVTEHQYAANGNRIATLRYAGGHYDVSALSSTTALGESQLNTWVGTQDLTELERTDYAYDFRGNLSSATAYGATEADGDGVAATASVTHFVYDQRGLLLQRVDARGEATSTPDDFKTTYTYDGLGRLLTATQWTADGDVQTTLNEYDGAGQATTLTLANGLTTTRVFDDSGRLLSVAQADGAQALGTTEYAYDAEGRLRRVTDPTGVSRHVVYDDAGRKIFDVDGDGSLTEYVYDHQSNLIETIQYAALADTDLLTDVAGDPLDGVDIAALRTSASGNPSQNRISRAVYDEANRLVYTIATDGAVSELRYDGASRLTDTIAYANRVTIASSITELLPEDVNALLTASASDRRMRQFHDGDGNLLASLDAAGYLVEYIYNDAGRLERTIGYATATPAGQRASGNLSALRPQADAANDVVSRFFYDGQGRRVGVLDSESYLTETLYDDVGNVAQTIRYDVQRTYTTGDSLDDLRPVGLGDSQVRSYEYDAFSRVSQETNHEGSVTEYQYDDVGNLISSTKALGTGEARTAQVRYDALGRVTAELTAEGSSQITGGMTQTQIDAIWDQYSIRHTYDNASRRILTTDQNGNQTFFFYDTDGRLTHAVNALGEVRESRYNALNELIETVAYSNRVSTADLTGGLVNATLTGRVTAAADVSKDARTTIEYTAAGRVETTTTAEGATITRTYNTFGDEVTRTEEIDATHSLAHQYTYDARGLLTEVRWDPSGLNTSQANEYDAFGRVVSTTDANGNVRERTYDRLGQVIETLDPLNGERTTTYDAFSRVLTTTDALGNTTEYAYDDVTRSVLVTTPEDITFSTVRNRHGQTATVTDGRGAVTSYEYDANGQLIETSDALGVVGGQTYDRAGRLIETIDGNGVVTALAYDAANRLLTRTVDPQGLNLQTTYSFDGKGLVIDTTDANGVVTRKEYDRDGRVTAVVIDPSGLALRTEYQYDSRGSAIRVTEGAGSANPRVTEYVYDTLGRRTSEIVDPGSGKLNLTTSYQYDANGNVIRKTDAKSNAIRYVYDASDRLRYTIDPLGGLTETTYDAENRIAGTRRYATAINTASLPSGTATVAQVQALIQTNALDRRQQSVYDKDGREAFTIDSLGGVTKKEYDGNGNVVRTHVYSERVASATYLTPSAVQAALTAVSDGNTTNDRETRAVYDIRNRATFMIDGAGAVMRTEYDGVGNIVVQTAFAALRPDSDLPSLATMEAWVASNSSASADRSTRMWHDAANRLVFALDAESFLRETRYDDVGRVTEEIAYFTAPTISAGADLEDVRAAIVPSATRDQGTERTYDEAGRLLTVTDAENSSESYTYDAVGNRLTFTNKKAATWTYVYDANRRLIEEHTPQVAVTTVGESGGNLTTSTANASIVTRMIYDALGNVTSRTEAYGRPEARTTTYQYDAIGRQTRTDFPTMSVYNAAADSAALAGTAVVRAEASVTPFSQVTYDTLGNAVLNRDVAGNYSHKAYDGLGRLQYEVDAELYVTEYRYDTFGNQTDLIRYANKMGLSGLTESQSWSSSQIASRISASATQDRKIQTTYDRLNRVSQVTQPSAFSFESFNSTAQTQTFTAGAATTYQYNAFGQVTKESRLVNPLINLWSESYSYYDRRGNKRGEVDPLGYLTTFEYDETGDLTQHVEYAKKLTAGSWSASSYGTPTSTTPTSSPDDPAGYDRKTVYDYDRLNRKVSETRVGIEFSQVSGQTVTKTVADQTTTLGYDALGNQTRVTNTAGAATFMYYDVLGRMIATAEPTRDPGDGTTLTPLTEMRRDVFGNLVAELRYANGASSATETAYSLGSASTNDRVTRLQLDGYGHAIRSQDAMGFNRYASYDVKGALAKEWQHVTDVGNNVDALVTIYEYDKLGRQTRATEPQRLGTSPVIVKTESQYNAFGEITGRGINGGFQEFFHYDQAGRVWRTNSGDGVTKVYLYNLAGQVTSEIRSPSLTLTSYAGPSNVYALATGNLIRKDTRYDIAGRVVDQNLPNFFGAGRTFVPSAIAPLYTTFKVGDVTAPNNPAAVYRQTLVNGGIKFIVDPMATVDQDGGYYFDGTNYVQDPNYEVVTSRYVQWMAPVDQNIEKVFEYRLTSDPQGSWQALSIVQLPSNWLGVNVEELPVGEYEYRVSYTRTGETTPYTQATGIVTLTGTAHTLPSIQADQLDDAGLVAPIYVRSDSVGGLSGSHLVTATVLSSAGLDDIGPAYPLLQLYFHDENRVRVSFPPIDGPTLIELEYKTQALPAPYAEDEYYSSNYPIVSKKVSLLYDNARSAAAGLTLAWQEPAGIQSTGGVSAVTKVRVYKLSDDGVYELAYQSGESTPEAQESIRNSVLTWKAPRDTSVTPSFQVRPAGATDWQPLQVVREGQYYVVDARAMPNGAYEYQVTYTRDNVLTASAAGQLQISGGRYELAFSGADEPPVPETAAPIETVNTSTEAVIDIVGFQSASSALEEAVEHTDGYESEPQTIWNGSNVLDLEWDNLYSGPVKVELDYISASHAAYENTGTSPERWRLSGTAGGVGQSKTFEFSSAAQGAHLEWQDVDGDVGGVSSIQQIRVYFQDSGGNWVERYTRDAGPYSGSAMYWKAPSNSAIAVKVELSPSGTDTWEDMTPIRTGLSNEYLAVVLEELDAGDYDYRITYSAIRGTTGGLSVISSTTGVVSIPSWSTEDPITVTQSNLLLAEGLGTVGTLVASGTTISWDRAPQAGTSIVVRHREQGETTWQESAPQGSAPDFSFDLGSGAVEFEILYYRVDPDAPYARATGTLDPATAPRVVPAESVAPLKAGNVGPVEIDDWISATQELTGDAIFMNGNSVADYFSPDRAWVGDNELNLSWEAVGSGPLRVELDYVTASRYSYDYTGYNYFGIDNAWSESPSLVPGVSRHRVFDLTNASTGATLSWTDDANAPDGGIAAIDRVRVYKQDGQGNWILAYDRDGAAPLGGRSLYWAAPADGALTSVFRIKPAGTDEWQRIAINTVSDYLAVDLAGLATGDYDYQLTYERNGIPTATASGVVSVTSPASGSQVLVNQTNIVFEEGLGDLGLVSASGQTLSWSHAAQSGDTIVVRSRAVGASEWTEQQVGTGGPNFSMELPGSGLAALDYEILYTHSGENEPYARSAGTLNQSVLTRVTKARMTLTQTATFVTEPLPITGLRTASDLISWTMPAEPNSSVTFRYREPAGNWIPLTASQNGADFSVNPSALDFGTYFYEISYVRTGETEPYALASGSMVLRRVFRGGNSSLEVTTYQQGTYITVAPNPQQQIDRWGNALSVVDALGSTTNYRYNQLNELIEVKQPQVQVVDTSDGTVTMANERPVSENYYDILGRLIGTLDANGNLNRAAYNAAGQLIADTHADSGQRHFSYDAFGHQVAIENELGLLTRNTYDKADRLTVVKREVVMGGISSNDPNQAVTDSYVYDEAGRRISETDGAGATTRYFYDLNNNLVRRRTPRDFDTAYEYDTQGNVTRELDANGKEKTWTYNYFGQLTENRDLSNAKTTYTYNKAGLLTNQTSTLGQNLSYAYDAAGRLVQINDFGNPTGAGSAQNLESVGGRVTAYEYDAADRRIHETTTIGGVTHQDSRILYDALGRIVKASDLRSEVSYSYDAASNRTHIAAIYYDHNNTSQDQNLWYTYDAMNRVLVSQGVNVGGEVEINAQQGIELEYNVAGQRINARQFGSDIELVGQFNIPLGTPSIGYRKHNDYVEERYTYDGLGRLLTTEQLIDIDMFGSQSQTWELMNSRHYDGASREISDQTKTLEGTSFTTRVRETEYDLDGRTVAQSTKKNGLLESLVTFGDAQHLTGTYTIPNYNWYEPPQEVEYDYWTDGYDAAGVLRGYSVAVYKDGKYQYTTKYEEKYRLGDTYQQTQESASSSTTVKKVSVPRSGSVTREYNVNGELVSVTDSRAPDQNRYFANSASGQALTVVQGSYEGAGQADQALKDALLRADDAVKAQHFFFANGQQIGSFGQLQSESGAFEANFDVNFTPISSGYPSSIPSQVIVQAGESLRIIAARIFGDPNLWYVLAEANGLTDPDAELTEGLQLTVPNEVISLSNTSSTFKPFDVSEAIGDTTPTQPMPPPRKKKGCGVLGQILVIVVAVVATVFTAGAAAGALGASTSGGLFATGASVFAGTATLTSGAALGAGAAFGAAAIGGAVGSIASQGVAIAAGLQDGFDWKGVALSALGAGVTAGLGASSAFKGVVSGLTGNQYAAAAINAAAGSALTQGVAVATGLQSSFSWREVAISAVSAPVARSTQGWINGIGGSEFVGQIGAGISGSLVRGGLGGKIDATSVLVDAFGNALGNSIVSKMSGPPMGMTASAGSDMTTTRSGTNAAGGSFDGSRYRNSALDRLTLEDLGDPQLSNNPTDAVYQPGVLGRDGAIAYALDDPNAPKEGPLTVTTVFNDRGKINPGSGVLSAGLVYASDQDRLPYASVGPIDRSVVASFFSELGTGIADDFRTVGRALNPSYDGPIIDPRSVISTAQSGLAALRDSFLESLPAAEQFEFGRSAIARNDARSAAFQGGIADFFGDIKDRAVLGYQSYVSGDTASAGSIFGDLAYEPLRDTALAFGTVGASRVGMLGAADRVAVSQLEGEGVSILFGQRRLSERFSPFDPNGNGPPDYLAGRSVYDVARDLRAGVLSPDQLPINAFLYGDELVSANTRSLGALSLSGFRPTNVNVITPSQNLLDRLGQRSLLPNSSLPGPRIPITPSQRDLTILDVIEISGH